MATLFGPPNPSSPLFEAQMFHSTQLWSLLSLPYQARAGSVPPQTSITPSLPRGLSSPAVPWAQGVPELPTGTRRVRGLGSDLSHPWPPHTGLTLATTGRNASGRRRKSEEIEHRVMSFA